MEKREVRLVDAFATEPATGRPVAVVPGDPPTPRQRSAIASEFGVSGVITASDEQLTYTDCDGSQAVISGAVAGYAALQDTDEIAAGTHELAVDGPISPSAPFLVDLESDGRVSVDVGTLSPAETALDTEAVATALGVDPAALADVGADLPLARVEAFGGTVLAAVNFLQHLNTATPDPARLADRLADADAQRLCAFTFDTLDADSDVHARIFDPSARGDERPASGVAAAACSAHLASEAAFDGDREEIRVESGHRQNRPAAVTATLSRSPRVGGAALSSLSGRLSLPDDEGGDDEIIEV